MLINNKSHQTIWTEPADKNKVYVIDQRYLPHRVEICTLTNYEETCFAIKNMIIRGAPLIGVTAAYGVYLATLTAVEGNFKEKIKTAIHELLLTRPTAVNLHWALNRMEKILQNYPLNKIKEAAFAEAEKIKQEDILMCENIGKHGLIIIEEISKRKKGGPVNILTHCNAGWLACVEWGTATSAIYQAHKKGIKLHVWVDETRPRNQGANLTAFELLNENIPHTLITDNTGGHLMQHGMVDMAIVGADRITANGDAANKIGTYLKALAAKDNNIPFYVAAPSSTIDWKLNDGLKEIPIEERNADEVKYVEGLHNKEIKSILICPEKTPAANYAFDVTPARLITGIITEKGITTADKKSLHVLFS
ncbi:MAG TPA: S-methyl-5-thioribose-1-phosphate isomerase [Bacteroidia bacterium]|jgi:methylthioribose-1-phosphate isomerase|nr:S-methyl-5-thioribose-1-phosphate isomerase [Bacteroidia bacterium]